MHCKLTFWLPFPPRFVVVSLASGLMAFVGLVTAVVSARILTMAGHRVLSFELSTLLSATQTTGFVEHDDVTARVCISLTGIASFVLCKQKKGGVGVVVQVRAGCCRYCDYP